MAGKVNGAKISTSVFWSMSAPSNGKTSFFTGQYVLNPDDIANPIWWGSLVLDQLAGWNSKAKVTVLGNDAVDIEG
jgi:hypothetical protein